MKTYSRLLAGKPQIVVFNKTDAVSEKRMAELKRLKFRGRSIYFISAAAHHGTRELINTITELLPRVKHRAEADQLFKVFTIHDLPYARFEVVRQRGRFMVKGPKQERLAVRTDLDNPQAQARFYKILRRMGVLAAVQRAGAKEGDIIKIGRKEFPFEGL